MRICLGEAHRLVWEAGTDQIISVRCGKCSHSWCSRHRETPKTHGRRRVVIKELPRGFPGGAVVKNLPANAEYVGLSPGPGRSHMPQSN